MGTRKLEETYYDLLKVDRKATIAEIVAAYHTAKNAFSRDSVATYSLFNADEAQSILKKLDEAYQTLSNIERKREYDEWLRKRAEEEGVPPLMTELEMKQKAQRLPQETASPEAITAEPPAGSMVAPAPVTDAVSGAVLREVREKRALSIEEVSRITKIPTKFIEAIEREAGPMPARVYLQGFIKNLATLYKLDPKTTVACYLERLDKNRGGTA